MHTLKPDTEKACFVYKAFELYATGNYSLEELLKEVHRWGLTAKAGKPIFKSCLAKMLRNPFYYGVMIYKGERFEPEKEFITTCNRAGSVAWQGNLKQKRAFLKILGSNLVFKDRTLIMKRAYPYELVAKISPSGDWLPDRGEISVLFYKSDYRP